MRNFYPNTPNDAFLGNGNVAQPMLSDFGLYKCQVCGKLVMGYEKDRHVKDVHRGRDVEWRKLK